MATKTSLTPPAQETSPAETVETTELLELLGDEYTRRVLSAVTDGARTGCEVMDAADVSKATAYRRLGDLEDAGLVETEMVIDPDGHHHETFRAVVESVTIRFDEGGLGVSVETGDL